MRLNKQQYKELMRRQPQPITFFNRVSSVTIADVKEHNRISIEIGETPLPINQIYEKAVTLFVGA